MLILRKILRRTKWMVAKNKTAYIDQRFVSANDEGLQNMKLIYPINYGNLIRLLKKCKYKQFSINLTSFLIP